MATGPTRKPATPPRKPAATAARKAPAAAKKPSPTVKPAAVKPEVNPATAQAKPAGAPAAAKPAAATAAKAAAPKPPATAKTPDSAPIPQVVKVSEPAAAQPDLKKKELLDEVVARSGIKKKDAKPVVEAMLHSLGEALADGRELNLQPLGKLRINRTEEHTGYRIVVCKLRQKTGEAAVQKPKEDPLADAAE